MAAIARRGRPGAMLVDESVVHDFCVELRRQKRVAERVYADALALGINGYYTLPKSRRQSRRRW